MRDEKLKFDKKLHTQPDKIAQDKLFQVRVVLNKALVEYMLTQSSTQFNSDIVKIREVAQKLVFLPSLKWSWGPYEEDIKNTAKNLVDAYLAYCEAFAEEDFPDWEQAAIETLKTFEFSL